MRKRHAIRLLCLLPAMLLAGCIANTSSTSGSQPPPSQGITVTPAKVTVPAGATQQFQASVADGDDSVNWQVNGVTGGNAALGTISTDGVYTTPLLPPAGGAVTITAVAVSDASKTGSATATFAYSNASFKGVYVFRYRGVVSGSGIAAAGSFSADGAGNISAGNEDVNAPAGTFLNLAFNGSYDVNDDGRGTLTITSNRGSFDFFFVFGSDGTIEITQAATDGVAAGEILRRSGDSFGTDSIDGNYVFALEDADTAIVGGLTFDGEGGVTGIFDENAAGAITTQAALSGSDNVDTDGRGTLTLAAPGGLAHYVFYVVSTDRIELVQVDNGAPLAGFAAAQQNDTFSNEDISGDYVFDLSGSGITAAGLFTATGGGGIDSGVIDRNDGGSVLQNRALTGVYSVTENGRATFTLTTPDGRIGFVAYLIDGDHALILEVDGVAVAAGEVFAQQGEPYTNGDFHGGYALFNGRFDATAAQAEAGAVRLDGDGGIAGSESVNDNGSLMPDVDLSGTYTFADNGRGTLTLTSGGGANRQFVAYVVSPQQILLIAADTRPAGVLSLAQQF